MLVLLGVTCLYSGFTAMRAVRANEEEAPVWQENRLIRAGILFIFLAIFYFCVDVFRHLF